MKKIISVSLILILILGVIFSAPASLFLSSAKAQNIINSPNLSMLPSTAVKTNAIPIAPASPSQSPSNIGNVPSNINNPNVLTNLNNQNPVRPGVTAISPVIPARTFPPVNPNQQQQLQQQQVGRTDAPIPNAGKSQSVYEGTTVMLDGSKSYDPNPGGSILNYRWVQTSGIPVILDGSGNNPNPTFVAPRLSTAGSTTTTTSMLTFSLMVTDSLGLTSINPSTTTVAVTYNPQLHNPHANSPFLTQTPNTAQQQKQPLPQQIPFQPLQQLPQRQLPPGSKVIPFSPPLAKRNNTLQTLLPVPNNSVQVPTTKVNNKTLSLSSSSKNTSSSPQVTSRLPFPNTTQQQQQQKPQLETQLQALQTSETGSFSASYHFSHVDIGDSGSVRLDGFMEGNLSRGPAMSDGRVPYTPIGTWHVTIDYVNAGPGPVNGHHYNGPASTDTSSNASHVVFANPQIVYDPNTNTFSGQMVATTTKTANINGIQFVAPIGAAVGAAPLTGNATSANLEVFASWTFSPSPLLHNSPPDVDAGQSQVVNPGDTVTLHGSATDPDNDALTYEWSQLSGTPVQWTSTQNILQPTFTAPAFDTNNDANDNLQFQLGVNDDHGNVVVVVANVTINPVCPTTATTTINTNTIVAKTAAETATTTTCNHPPVAVAKAVPPEVIISTSPLALPPFLDGKSSFDPDPGDSIKSYQWTKTQPADNIVPDTLSDPSSPTPTYDVPNNIPAQFTSLTTPTKLLPLHFQLSVEDNHGLKNVNTDTNTVSVDVKCNSADQATAQKSRAFIEKIINPTIPITEIFYPQAGDNFQYWVSGKGDPKPVSVSWLDTTIDFTKAQRAMATQIQNDVVRILSQMKNGESTTFQKDYKYDITSTSFVGPFPSDFAVAVGRANTFASVNLVITKSSLFGAGALSGKITLTLKDTYDFNPGRIFNIRGIGVITANDLNKVKQCLGARDYNQDTIYSKIIAPNAHVSLPDFPTTLINCRYLTGVCRIQ